MGREDEFRVQIEMQINRMINMLNEPASRRSNMTTYFGTVSLTANSKMHLNPLPRYAHSQSS